MNGRRTYHHSLRSARTEGNDPRLLIQEAAHLAAARRVLQLAQRLRLALADALALPAELRADLSDRVVGVPAAAEAHAPHPLLALGENTRSVGVRLRGSVRVSLV